MNRQKAVTMGLGVFALVLGSLGAYTIGHPRTPPLGTEVVARTTIYPGEPITAGRVFVAALPRDYIPYDALPAYGAVAGHRATTTLYPGDPVLSGDVSTDPVLTRIGIPQGMEAVTLGVQGNQLAGTVAGEDVNIVSTTANPQFGITMGEVLAPDVPIVSFFNADGAAMGAFAAGGGTAAAVEIAMTPQDIARMAAVGTSFAYVLDPWFLGTKGSRASGSAAGSAVAVQSAPSSAHGPAISPPSQAVGTPAKAAAVKARSTSAPASNTASRAMHTPTQHSKA